MRLRDILHSRKNFPEAMRRGDVTMRDAFLYAEIGNLFFARGNAPYPFLARSLWP